MLLAEFSVTLISPRAQINKEQCSSIKDITDRRLLTVLSVIAETIGYIPATEGKKRGAEFVTGFTELHSCCLWTEGAGYSVVIRKSVGVGSWEMRNQKTASQSSWLQIQRSRFHSRPCQIFWDLVGLERGPLSLLSTIEALLGRESNGSGLENRDCGLRGSTAMTTWHPSIRKSWYQLRRQAVVARSV
jgi:hypothetical protein